LIVAGVALAFGLDKNRPPAAALVVGIASLVCVCASVVNAALATMTVVNWQRQFPEHIEYGGSPYSFAEVSSGTGGREDFREFMVSRSEETILDEALAELWQIGVLHRYRYRRLRVALRWFLAALALLLITIALSALI
jgi:hypothetical protein